MSQTVAFLVPVMAYFSCQNPGITLMMLPIFLLALVVLSLAAIPALILFIGMYHSPVLISFGLAVMAFGVFFFIDFKPMGPGLGVAVAGALLPMLYFGSASAFGEDHRPADTGALIHSLVKSFAGSLWAMFWGVITGAGIGLLPWPLLSYSTSTAEVQTLQAGMTGMATTCLKSCISSFTAERNVDFLAHRRVLSYNLMNMKTLHAAYPIHLAAMTNEAPTLAQAGSFIKVHAGLASLIGKVSHMFVLWAGKINK